MVMKYQYSTVQYMQISLLLSSVMSALDDGGAAFHRARRQPDPRAQLRPDGLQVRIVLRRLHGESALA